eukprot:contig_2039_g351
MMADTRRAWEQLDADKARSRKEQISTTRNEVAAGGSVIQAFSSNRSTFVTGSPGVGKSTFLKGFHIFLKEKWPHEGEVVNVAPTGSSAKTASRQTYHSFFGLPRDHQAHLDVPAAEAGRILKQDRFRFISCRLGQVRVLLLDGVSMVPAARLFVMVALLHLSQPATSPPCVLYAFGDLLQLGPLSGSLAFLSAAWRELFGITILELALVHRQSDSSLVQVIEDARNGRCSSAAESLMNDCAVSDERYEELKCNVFHLMPRHEEVQKHNAHCLQVLFGNKSPLVSIAIDDVEHEKDRDQALPGVDLSRVSEHSWIAALVDCVAPRCVPHCLRARLMLTNNRYLGLGLYHGSIGILSSYKEDGTPVVRFDHQKVPCVAVRRQLPFFLGWGITVHSSQSLSLSGAVLDIAQAFGAGMVSAAISRVADKKRMYVKSSMRSHLFADPVAIKFYREGSRL